MDEKHYLSPLFEPRSVAIIGATERKEALGAVLIRNMIDAQYKGSLYAVNPKYKEVQGVPCYHSIADVPVRIDLAVIATPAETVPAIIEECGKAHVRTAVVISAGFGESGSAGEQLEMEVVRTARQYGLRVLGPNSLGIARPLVSMNCTFAQGKAIPGSIGFVSQSGALCAAVLDYARPNQVGFSNVVSLGVSADLDFGEILDYMVSDFRTDAILVYIEGIRDARRFLSALRAAARVKPVMVLKVGRHPTGSRAAQAHTGAVTMDDAVFDAALRRAGVIRLYTMTQLYGALKGLFAHFRPRGDRLAIITNGGGPGVMAADRAGDLGLRMARLMPNTLARLEEILPQHWSRENPVDLVGDSDPDRYANALEALLKDENVDGVLCLLSPQAMTHPTDVAQRVVALQKKTDKAIVTCWLGDDLCKEGREVFRLANIPSLRTPENAVDLFSHISSYYRNQQLLAQVPAPLNDERPATVDKARNIAELALAERRTLLLRHETMEVLNAFLIPTTQIRVVHSVAEAVDTAVEMGFPVSIRPNTQLHGTRLQHIRGQSNLVSTVALHLAYEEISNQLSQTMPQAIETGMCIEPHYTSPYVRELMVRVWRDPVFGPVIGFGERSLDPNYWPDRAVALPPLNVFLVQDLIRNTRAAKMLGPLDGMPAADIDAVEQLLLRVSEIVCEMPWVRSLEINPLYADDRGALVGDARIEIGKVHKHAGRYEHMAIHPYPSDLVTHDTLKDGTDVTIRPMKPEDADLVQEFTKRLSSESRYYRFMSALRELSPAMLAKLTQLDYDRELAFNAVILRDGKEFQIGVCRYSKNPDGASCEFAIVVADEFQHSGLGRILMNFLIKTAWQRGLKTMKGVFLSNNDRMLAFVKRLGFVLSNDPEDNSIKNGILDLAKANTAATE